MLPMVKSIGADAAAPGTAYRQASARLLHTSPANEIVVSIFTARLAPPRGVQALLLPPW